MTEDMNKTAMNAEKAYVSNPTLYNLVWYGRRVGYTGDFERAIQIYTDGLDRFPDEPELLRHRAHRYISLRRYDDAIADLIRAKAGIQGKEDRIEEDGMPNAKNIPLSTLHFNVYYHLGLAYYLMGDFENAWIEYENCLGVSTNDDSVIACTYWLYLISRRVTGPPRFSTPDGFPDMEIIENYAYYHLLQLFLGSIDEAELKNRIGNSLDKATIHFGLAMYHHINGKTELCKEILRKNIEDNHQSAFGTLASQAELDRI